MRLFNVILGTNDKYNNNWTITKDQYDNDVVLNESTSQKIKIGKYLVPSLEQIYEYMSLTEVGDDLITSYNFSDDGHHVVNKKNLSIIMIKNSKNDANKYDNEHLLYVTIPTDNVKLIDSIINLDCCEIINSYRSSGMIGAVIKIDTNLFPLVALENNDSAYIAYKNSEIKIGEFFLYNQNSKSETDKVIKKVITIDRDLTRIHIATFFITSGYYYDVATQTAETNFFKKLMISPSKSIRTSIYIVNEKLVDKVSDAIDDDDVTILSVNPKIFKGPDSDKEMFDQVMTEHILHNRVKAVTVVGIKLPKEVYNKYRISTCFAHDLESGIIRCVKC